MKVTEIKGIAFAGFYKAVSSFRFYFRIRRSKTMLILFLSFRRVWKGGCLGFYFPSVRKYSRESN